jgi:hypothetical protein
MFALVVVFLFPLVLNAQAMQFASVPSEYVIVSENTTTTSQAPKFGFNFEAYQAYNNANHGVLYNWLSNYFLIKLLRYPGGTISGFWDWKAGNVNYTLCKEGVVTGSACTTNYSYYPEAFATVINDFWSDAVPVWDLNCLTSPLEYQLELLLYAQKLGLDTSFVELGNEYYLPTPINTATFHNGSVYHLSLFVFNFI